MALGEHNYPAGVTNADFATEDPPCCCGCLADDHDPDGCNACRHCHEYEPQEDTRA